MMQTVIQRLKDAAAQEEGALPLKYVAGAAEFAALEGPPPKHLQPGAYVIRTTDRAAPSELIGKHRQHVTLGIAVVLALGNLADPRGAGAAAAMDALERDVALRLVGWMPTGAIKALSYQGARTLGLRDQVVWRQLDFTLVTKLQP